jgi:hypothetical protein
MDILDKKDTLFESLKTYYKDPTAKHTLEEFLGKKSPISLRTLDYLVTNYSKKHNVVYLVGGGGVDKNVNLYVDYKSQLKAFSKRYFDPFCRRERVEYAGLVTTVGQLNFMRWAILNGVIDYARANLGAIEEDMMDKAATRAKDAKRKELCKAAIKGATKTAIKVTVRFS